MCYPEMQSVSFEFGTCWGTLHVCALDFELSSEPESEQTFRSRRFRMSFSAMKTGQLVSLVHLELPFCCTIKKTNFAKFLPLNASRRKVIFNEKNK